MLFAPVAIGRWEDDVEANLIRGDAVMAHLFGLPPEEMADGITLSQMLSMFHPDDRDADTAHRRRVREDGGAFAWEHRVVTPAGEVRWILARGQFVRDANGRVRGSGVVIDMTDTRVHDTGPGSAAFLAADGGGPPLERMADRIVDAWEMSGGVGSDDWDRLRPLFENLLFELGRQIAATLPDDSEILTDKLSGHGIH
ncbi:PAS domain-containing protein [Methylobacterium sp. WL120]|nr:PAS domain-containing protein [Methylobacterium sp. WL120]